MTDWHKALDEDVFSVGLAPMSDMSTEPEDGDYVWLYQCDMPQVTDQASAVESSQTKRSYGSGTAPSVGRVWHEISLRYKWQGQAADYEQNDVPALTGLAQMLESLGGSAAVAYAAADLTGTDANTVAGVSSAKLGCLLASVASGVVTPLGFVEEITGSYSHQLAEDGPATAGTGVGRASTKTWFPAAAVAPKYAVRICGADTSVDHRHLGVVLSRATLSWDEDDNLWIEVVGTVYGGLKTTSPNGGLREVTQFLSMQAVSERPGARVVVASNITATGQDTGTPAPAGTCDAREVSIAIEWPHKPVRCPPNALAPEGVIDCVLRSPSITGSLAVPQVSDWDESGESLWVRLYRTAAKRDSRFSLSVFQGNALGRVVAARIGRAHLTAYPSKEFIDGMQFRRINWRADHNDGDAAATDAGRKPFVLAVG